MDSKRDSIVKQIEEIVTANWDILHPVEGFEPGRSYIPYAGRVFDHHEVMAVIESGLDFWLTAGERVEEFENLLAEFIGGTHSSSGRCPRFYRCGGSHLQRHLKRYQIGTV